jgi:hypothetical protein
MPWRSSYLAKPVWCSGGFLYLHGQFFLQIWELFCYYFVEYIKYSSGLHLFSFFNAHDAQVWSFDGVAELLHIPFAALVLFGQEFLCFFLQHLFIFSSEILSSTCSSLPLCFLFD